METPSGNNQQAVGNVGVGLGEAVRTTEKDLKDSGIRTTGLDFLKKEDKQEGEARNLGTYLLMRQQDD